MNTSRRRFNTETSLECAMNLFWQRGYEATSMAALLDAMELTAPSLYAAFGNKEKLFYLCLERWKLKYRTPIYAPLSEHQDVTKAFDTLLRTAAHIYTDSNHPSGCFINLAGTNCSPASGKISRELQLLRAASEAEMKARLCRSASPDGTLNGRNPAAWAKYFELNLRGISMQARDGAAYDSLNTVIDIVMSVWKVSLPEEKLQSAAEAHLKTISGKETYEPQ